MTIATPAAYRAAAEEVGCTVATIRAVFRVEASGRFFNPDGTLVRRFEPHHFPGAHWPTLGFAPRAAAPWRASKRLSKRRRAAMYDAAERIDAEAAARAASWGAAQIMGFNHAAAGYGSALDMVRAFEASADEHVIAFARFVVSKGLDSALRGSDWHTFATGYNGTGQAAAYAAKIESSFRRETGGRKSPAVVRDGAAGASVVALQEHLVAAGYHVESDGTFGPATRAAVVRFQGDHGLAADGVAGARTWAKLREVASNSSDLGPTFSAAPLPTPKPQQGAAERLVERAVGSVGPMGAAGMGGALLDRLGDHAVTILVGGVVAAGLVVLAVWAAPKIRESIA
jgi:hypothetical protein